jgi:L-amino acid N-acyltransferase YncA
MTDGPNRSPEASSSVTIRACEERDGPAITEIYGYHVLHGAASFELEPPDAAEMARRRRAVVDGGYPYFVAEQGGRGIGRVLLEALLEACERSGFRQVVAVIGDSANEASIGLHRHLGFRMAGTLQSAGFKFGRWIDIVLMQRALGPGDGTLPSR